MRNEKKNLLSSLLNPNSSGFKEPKKPYIWKEFLNFMSNEIDNVIKTRSSEKRCEYIKGKCTFTPTVKEDEFSKETTLNIDVLLYFKITSKEGNNAERYPLHTERNFKDFKLEDKETLEALRNLMKTPLEIEVAKPK